MSESPTSLQPQPLFGRLAVEKGYVSQAQLDQVLRLHTQLGGGTPLGALFVQRGLLTLVQVQELLRHQRAAEQARLAAQGPAAAPSPPPPPAPIAVRARPGIPSPPAQPTPPPPLAKNPFDNLRSFQGGGGPAAVAPPKAAVAARPPTPAPQAASAPVPMAAAPNVAEAMPEPDLIRERTIPPPPSAAALQIQAGAKPGKLVFSLLDAARKRDASDIHLHAGMPPALRVAGQLVVLDQAPIDRKTIDAELRSILSEEQRKALDEGGDLDFALTLPSGLRVRANMYRSLAGLDGVFRLISSAPQTLEELQLPSAVAKLIAYHQGLVLVTGPTGSGKSTTLASLVHLLNEERPEHILSLEDPIEIVHPAMRALVNQRQVGRDTESFARALRGALREDPDIIVIGDLRDRETISLAITAAETGHLVIGSMNTNNASRTVGRLIDAFPPKQQGQVRAMLSESLRGVVSQRLLPSMDGGRVPATELLIVTPAIGNLIREGKLFQIRSQMQTGRYLGMRTLDESLKDLVLTGKVDSAEARQHAETPNAIPSGPAPAAPAAPTPAAAQAPAAKPGAPLARMPMKTAVAQPKVAAPTPRVGGKS